MRLNLFIIILTVFTLSACKKSGSTKTAISPPKDIYIVGSDNFTPVYWKNGVETHLTTTYAAGNFTNADASWITISGNDIYISGGGESHGVGTAVYWKNGIIDTLPSLNEYVNEAGYASVITYANAIVVLGNDIYVGGYQTSTYIGIKNGAILWKNGVPTAFGGPSDYITSLFVSNGNIYSVGFSDTTGVFASYYKNRAMVNLDKSDQSSAYDIYVSGNDVYATGYINLNAVYWKNGVVNWSSSTPSGGHSIYVSGNDVYVGGSETVNGIDIATIWKNGIATHLTQPGIESSCNQVLVSGDDVYALGSVFDSGHNSTATMWKNGVATTLAPSVSYAWTMTIK